MSARVGHSPTLIVVGQNQLSRKLYKRRPPRTKLHPPVESTPATKMGTVRVRTAPHTPPTYSPNGHSGPYPTLVLRILPSARPHASLPPGARSAPPRPSRTRSPRRRCPARSHRAPSLRWGWCEPAWRPDRRFAADAKVWAPSTALARRAAWRWPVGRKGRGRRTRGSGEPRGARGGQRGRETGCWAPHRDNTVT